MVNNVYVYSTYVNLLTELIKLRYLFYAEIPSCEEKPVGKNGSVWCEGDTHHYNSA